MKEKLTQGQSCAVLKVRKSLKRKRRRAKSGEAEALDRKKPGSEGESPGRAEVDGRSKPNRISGDNSLRDPPVPIPNTEVKPQHADGTWLATARESRSSPDSISLSSSMAEHSAVNRRVVGSSPTRGAIKKGQHV